MRNRHKVELLRDRHAFTRWLAGAGAGVFRLILEGVTARAEAIACTPDKKRVR